jgi:hypothetical protein
MLNLTFSLFCSVLAKTGQVYASLCNAWFGTDTPAPSNPLPAHLSEAFTPYWEKVRRKLRKFLQKCRREVAAESHTAAGSALRSVSPVAYS